MNMKEGIYMKNILFFGDSNTYGYKPDGSGRFDRNIRWTGRVSDNLGPEYNVIVEELQYFRMQSGMQERELIL